jgi:hypothetical protein
MARYGPLEIAGGQPLIPVRHSRKISIGSWRKKRIDIGLLILFVLHALSSLAVYFACGLHN